MPEDRFLIDENDTVVDAHAKFVLDCLSESYSIMDPRFSFYVNRVFKEYLFPRDFIGLSEYQPLDVRALMQDYDTSSYRFLESVWMPRYNHILFRAVLSKSNKLRCVYDGSALFVIDDKQVNRVEVVNDSLTLAALHALALLAFDTAVTVRTKQFRLASQGRLYPPI